MVLVIPDTLFSTKAQFATVGSLGFTTQNLSLIVKVEGTDSNLVENLKSLTLDGVPIWSHPKAGNPSLLFSKMPDGKYWASIEIDGASKAHEVRSNGRVKFAGYLYGYMPQTGFGWPIALSNLVVTYDTLAPVVTRAAVTDDCGGFLCTASEVRDRPSPPRSRPQDGDHVETGIAMIDSVRGTGSANYRLTRITDQTFPSQPAYRQFVYRWEVIDKSKPAKMIYSVTDFAQNICYDTLTYTPAKVQDTSAPRLQRMKWNEQTWKYTATEKVFVPDPPRKCPQNGDQIDQGLSAISVNTSNTRLIAETTKFSADTSVRTATFTIEVVDGTSNAAAIVSVTDRIGNVRRDSVFYAAPTSVSAHSNDARCTWTARVIDGRIQIVSDQHEQLSGEFVIRDIGGRVLESSFNDGVSWTSSRIYSKGMYFITIQGATQVCKTMIVMVY